MGSFVKSLEAMPKTQVILTSIAGAFGLAGFMSAILAAKCKLCLCLAIICLILAFMFRTFLVTLIRFRFCCCSISFILANSPPTMNKQWVAINREYMRYQKMNPIFGISSHK
jgi:uncharacterized membrane protein